MEEQTGEGETPQEINVSDAATDALRDALGTETSGNAESSETEETSEGIENQGVTPEAQAPEEATEVETQPVEATETEEERLAKRRIRPRNELDQQVIDLYRSEGFRGSMAEATDVIYGRPAVQAQPQASEAPEPVDPNAEYAETETKITSEIAELETKIKEAADNLDTTEAMDFQRELFRKELELSETRNQFTRNAEEAQRQADESQRQSALESRGRAIERFPDLGDNSTVYRKEFDHFVASAEQHPDYQAVFTSPRWPEILANEFAAQKGVSQQTQQPMPTPPPQQAPQIGSQAKVLTSGTAAQPSNTPLTKQQALEGLPDLSIDDLYAALGSDDGRRMLR